jgi:glycosyltransferase involved in cell wall biosynthesis
MKILMAHGTWYQTGGDWTYLKSIEELYSKRGVQIVPFSMLDDRNEPSNFSEYFVSNINYHDAHKKYSVRDVKNVVARAIYSSEAANNLSRLISEHSIDLAQLNSIHNIQTLSILPVLKAKAIPIVWRVLDYKILCPNRTFLSNGKICTKCISGNYFWSTVKACKKKSLPASFISSLDAYFNKYKKYYDIVDMFLLQSEFSKQLFLKAGFPESKLKIITNPYELTPGVMDTQKNQVDDDYILYFGRLSSEKGIHTLLEAMTYLSDVILYVIGDGPQLPYLQRRAEEISPGKIKFLGPMWGSDLQEIIKSAKLTVVPSEWFEVSPYVILQSFDLGIPVVGSRIGGIPDLIKDGYNGKLFESGDPLALAKAVADVLNDRETNYFDNCRKYLDDFHSPQGYHDATMSIFKELM